jgi:hypothetical protein
VDVSAKREINAEDACPRRRHSVSTQLTRGWPPSRRRKRPAGPGIERPPAPPARSGLDTAFPSGGGAGSGHTDRAGASIGAAGNIQACVLDPSLAQWALLQLTKVPDIVLWGWPLLLVWQLVSRASRDCPFTARTASTVQQFGWVVTAGSVTAGTLGALGADLLTC